MNFAAEFPNVTFGLIACMALVLIGSAVQIAVGAGLSVICGFSLMLWLGPTTAIPILLSLNLMISVVATVCDSRRVCWADAALATGATLAGCLFASLVPGLSDTVMKFMTACVLVVVALPRPPAPDNPPSKASGIAVILLAGCVTGALTVWTAIPGPITPVAFARAGRSGVNIRRTMQPISLVGYGAALASASLPTARIWSENQFPLLVAATLAGIFVGYIIRPSISADRVTLMIRFVAAAAAAFLTVSALR